MIAKKKRKSDRDFPNQDGLGGISAQ